MIAANSPYQRSVEELPVPGLTLEKVSELLGVEIIQAEPWQIKKLCRWVEGILRSRGEAYLRENRTEILGQWEQYMKNKFKTCA
jgi:hypothetical protein